MPYASAYVTNGGYGGVMLALQHKVPIVVAGVHEDKDDIAACVHFNGVGIDLKTELANSARSSGIIPPMKSQPVTLAGLFERPGLSGNRYLFLPRRAQDHFFNGSHFLIHSFQFGFQLIIFLL